MKSLDGENDRSGLFYKQFAEWTEELGKNIALFGYSAVVKKLIDRYPGSYRTIVDLDPSKHGKSVGGIRIVGFDAYKSDPACGVIITDILRQYVYLDLIYNEILYPRGLVTVAGARDANIRYNYVLDGIAYGRDPSVFDADLQRIGRLLPMECTIPVESLVRIIDCVKTSIDIEGDILEIGTGLGGSTFYMASIIEMLGRKKTIISVDPFENEYYIPDLSYEGVARNLERFGFVKLLKGYAPRVLEHVDLERISFAFIDYYAFPDIMGYVYPRLVPGGMILIDNYNHGCHHNHGVPIANVFFLDKKEKIIRVGGTQGLVIKQPAS